MINNKKIVAMIPLRGGSKSIPKKNLALLGGKPLMAWPIETALQVGEIDKIIVSTDNKEIKQIALSYGVDVIDRPKNISTDDAVAADVIRHAQKTLLEQNEVFNYMVFLEATSPFRDIKTISCCIKRLEDEQLDSIATFNEADINPHRTWRIENGNPSPFIDGAVPWLPRQRLPKAYQLNGAVYVFNLETFPSKGVNTLYGKVGAEIIKNDSVIDIDTKNDLEIANERIAARALAQTI
jgi:CMP-N,N'-diacetyllegionaminic acid synthase